MTKSFETKRFTQLAVKMIFGLFAAFILMFANWCYPVVRFDFPILNAWFSLIWVFLPLLIIVLLFLIPVCWTRILAMIFVVPLLYFMIFFGAIVSFNFFSILKEGRDYSFEKIETVQYRGYRVSLYRTNGGATTDFGIQARQEIEIIPGLLIVRRIAMFYPAYSAHSQRMGKNKVLLIVQPYGLEQKGTSRTFVLRRFVYF